MSTIENIYITEKKRESIETLCDSIRKSKPFIYEIENEFYFLEGDKVIKCSDKEVDLYKQYRDTMIEIKKEIDISINFRDKSCDILAIQAMIDLDKIINSDHIPMPNEQNLKNFLFEHSDVISSIESQRNEYLESLKYLNYVKVRRKEECSNIIL